MEKSLSTYSTPQAFNEKRRGWLLLVTVWCFKLRNGLKQLVNKLQNVIFCNTHINCLFSESDDEFVSQGSKSKAWPKSVLKLCYSSVARYDIYVFLQGMGQYDTGDKHLSKFVMRMISKSAVVHKKKRWSLPVVSAKIKAEKKQLHHHS